MANFCIPKEYIEKVRKSVSEVGIDKLSSMTSKERRELFRKSLSDKASTRLNEEFEKSILSRKVNALKNWVKNNLDEKYRDSSFNESLQKNIKSLDDFNAYIDANAENLILKKNNLALTGDEVKMFNELGRGVFEEAKKLGDNMGDLSGNFEGNLNYAKKISELQNYADELTPSSKVKTLLNTFGKATMLASFKTPFLNIESNTITGIAEAISRRLTNKRLGGSVSPYVAKSYMKNARKIFKETGIDFTRMIDFENPVTGISTAVGEKLARPKGKLTRAYTDFIFNKTLSTPDVAFSSYAFTDSANLNASRLADGNSKRATEIFRDATRIEPKTTEGQIVRNNAVQDAMFSTYTNDSFTSRINENIRRLLNGTVDGLGDVIMPFVKTPSNVVEAGLDYSGLGIGKALFRAVKSIRGEGKITREAMHSITKDLVRSGIGMTAAFSLVANIKPENFMGAYDPDRIKIDQLDNTAYNAIKIGNKWVNVDYLGVLGTPVVSMLYAKKYGKESLGKRFAAYGGGMMQQFLKTPGIEPLFNLGYNMQKNFDPENTDKWLKFFGDNVKRTVMDIIASRSIPGIMYDFARATDDVQRDTTQKKYVINTPLIEINFDKFVQKIPFFRETLPTKYDALGRVMYEESPIESLMFGSRVKTSRMDAVTDEIYRLRNAGQTPNIKDLRFMYSSKVDELREKVGEEKFYEVARKYGEDLARGFEKEMNKQSYKDSSDEEKRDKLYDIGQELYVKTLKNNGVKYR